MQILHVDTGREWRGGQIQVALLWEALEHTGAVQQSLLAAPGPLMDHARRKGWPVKKASAHAVWKEALDVDFVHAHDARAHSFAALARVAGARASLVVSRRVAFPVRASFLSQWKYRQADQYLAVSQHVAEELMKAGLDRDRVRVVYDAVPHAEVHWQWQPGAPVVFLNSSDSGKCAEIAHKVATCMPESSFVWSTDLAASFAQPCAAFCYLSRDEGLGSAALLAMSMGVPVIASRVGGMTEIFEHERSGLYVTNRVEDVVAALRRITTDRDLAQRLSAEGVVRVRSCFTVARMAMLTLETYRSLRR